MIKNFIIHKLEYYDILIHYYVTRYYFNLEYRILNFYENYANLILEYEINKAKRYGIFHILEINRPLKIKYKKFTIEK